MANEKIKVTFTGSQVGCTEPQRRTLRALGLRKRMTTRVHDKTAVICGMIRKVEHLVTVEPAN